MRVISEIRDNPEKWSHSEYGIFANEKLAATNCFNNTLPKSVHSFFKNCFYRVINSVYIAERRPLHAWSEWKEKKKVNFVIVVNSNVSTCWRLTFKLWIIISGSWLVILNSKSRQVRGQEQSWFYTDWLVTGVPRKKWFSSLLTLFFLAVCITVLLFLVYGVSNVSMMNAAIIRIWNCFTVVASNWDFLLSIPQ